MNQLDFEIKTEKEEDKYGKFIISPLAPGYGSTLGNALRRVMISSLKGAAATKVKIKGVQHRFSTIKGVKEDVLELLLNIKEIRFKLGENIEKTEIKLSKTGPGVFTAADFNPSPGLEVINKDLILGTLADNKAKIELEIEVEAGYGYSPFEERGLEKIGVLPIDSVFSPVERINYKVEETRVGRVTNLDRLILEVWTDGAIKPREALNQASKILIDYFSRISLSKKDKSSVEKKEEEEEESIDNTALPIKVKNALKKEGIKSLNQLAKMNKQDLLTIKNLGQKSIKQIQEYLKEEGLLVQGK